MVVKGDQDNETAGRQSRTSPSRANQDDRTDDDNDGKKAKQKENSALDTNRSKDKNDNEVDENANRAKSDAEIKKAKDKRKSKGKAAIIFKSKLERQISNKDHVLEKYELGKTLGDGNFAIVKQCKLKNSNNEYAMKIIDKPKLRGKEHMIENEINIMKVCQHPNICKLVEEFETKAEIYLCMELVKVSTFAFNVFCS